MNARKLLKKVSIGVASLALICPLAMSGLANTNVNAKRRHVRTYRIYKHRKIKHNNKIYRLGLFKPIKVPHWLKGYWVRFDNRTRLFYLNDYTNCYVCKVYHHSHAANYLVMLSFRKHKQEDFIKHHGKYALRDYPKHITRIYHVGKKQIWEKSNYKHNDNMYKLSDGTFHKVNYKVVRKLENHFHSNDNDITTYTR